MAYMLIFMLKNVSSFCICKSYSHFFCKNTCELDIVLTRTVNILTTNKLVKLMMLWTTGPRKCTFGHVCPVKIQSDQNLHKAHFGLIRMQTFFTFFRWTMKSLIRLLGFTGWFESSLGVYVHSMFSHIAVHTPQPLYNTIAGVHSINRVS